MKTKVNQRSRFSLEYFGIPGLVSHFKDPGSWTQLNILWSLVLGSGPRGPTCRRSGSRASLCWYASESAWKTFTCCQELVSTITFKVPLKQYLSLLKIKRVNYFPVLMVIIVLIVGHQKQCAKYIDLWYLYPTSYKKDIILPPWNVIFNLIGQVLDFYKATCYRNYQFLFLFCF